MGSKERHDIPLQCPITGEDLFVSELTSEESGVTIRGRFRLPRVARLSGEQRAFLEAFLRARGVISTVEKELGISYPTVRSRLDALLKALDLKPVKDNQREAAAALKRKLLLELEEGKITPEEFSAKLRGEA